MSPLTPKIAAGRAAAAKTLTLNGRVSWPFFALAAILAVALALRLHGLNWDDGYGFHPDERDIYFRSDCMYRLLADQPGAKSCGYLAQQPEAEPGLAGLRHFLDPDRSPLNPHWFPLGSILIYMMVLVRSAIELFTDLGGLEMRYAGRTLSALADAGSVLLIFVLGRRLYGRNVGLLAAALTALAVIHIQNSHFYRPETFTVLLTLASIWATLRMVQNRRLIDSALLGLILGLALSPKVNVLPLLAPLALGYVYRILDDAGGRWRDITPEIVQKIAAHAALAAAVALAIFFITTPYAIIDIGNFIADVTAQTRMARNAGLWPFTTQYIDTPPFLYQIRQTAVWGLGLPLGIAAWLSLPATAALLFRDRRHRRADLMLLAWVIPSLLFLESFEVRFQRYLFPLMPVMILMAARMLLWATDRARALSSRPHTIRSFALPAGIGKATLAAAIALPIIIAAATAFYALAFQQVYANEHPALAAARWIRNEIPPQTAIVMDNHWDEWLPGLYDYQLWQFPLYEPDTPTKMRNLAGNLAHSDYLIFYSHRPYTSAARAPERFPYSNHYYRLLFSGQLGYQLHREFTNHPSLAGVTFRDDALPRANLPSPTPEIPTDPPGLTLNLGYADDNVSGYDHPRVLIFRNAAQLPESRLRYLLTELPPTSNPGANEPHAPLMLPPEKLAQQQSGGTFSQITNRRGWSSQIPVLTWLLAVELIHLLALPLAFFIFRPLPDRGILLSRILGLLTVCYIAWLAVSLDWIDFSRGAVYAGMSALAAASAATLWATRRELWQFARAKWRLLLFTEALFLTAFLAFTLIRYYNPDLWHPYRGGEKPMELAYLTAVFRSTALPPYDPWFAGGYLNYYYWGYFVVAALMRLTAIVPATAFNLAVPLFFALTVTGAFSIGYNLAAGSLRNGLLHPYIRKPESQRCASSPKNRRPIRPIPPLLCGLTAALFTAVIGNLDGIVQIAQNLWTWTQGNAWPGFDFWRSSRMIPPLESFQPPPLALWLPDHIPGDAGASWHITEFPYFTFLFADLHPHLMAIPFTILTLGLGLCLIAGLRQARPLWTAACALTLAVTLGSLWAINSWDYPSYLLLTIAFAATAAVFTRGNPRRKLTLVAILAAAIAAVSILSFWPFHQHYETFNNGLDASRWRTPVDRFLAIHGLFLFIIATWLILRTRRQLTGAIRSLWHRHDAPPETRWLRLILLPFAAIALPLALWGYWNAVLILALLTLLTLAGWNVIRRPHPSRPWEAAVLLMITMAALIAFGVDFVTVEGDIGRMNTLFKYYLEVWIFLSIAAAWMLWRLAARWLPRIRPAAAIAWLSVLTLLIGSSLIYTALGTRDRLADRFNALPPTLDGAAYMSAAHHWERETAFPLKWDHHAIQWLQDNVQGSPVILEAHMEQYRWGARIASYTGLPTIIGWPWHQTQQRLAYHSQIDQRARHVRLAYETADPAAALEILNRYNVAYIVVGELERINYPPEGLAKFEAMSQAGALAKVYDNGQTAIFRVKIR